MILAAGRGERMRPLSDRLPKTLLEAGGRTLLDHHLDALVAAGVTRVVINLSWQGRLIREHAGDGSARAIEMVYSDEGDAALETGGGIFHALDALGAGPFWVVNGDVWTDFAFAPIELASGILAHLVLVENSPQHPAGDFALVGGEVRTEGEPQLTFSGIGLYRAALFEGCEPGAFPLAPLLRRAMAEGRVRGERYAGRWFDVGTPARLEALRTALVSGRVS